MSYNLYFLPENRDPELIFSFDEYKENNIITKIKEDIYKRNQQFIIYYIRYWGDINIDGITFDVGSHTEFYKVKKG